jgi:hypothetical protein
MRVSHYTLSIISHIIGLRRQWWDRSGMRVYNQAFLFFSLRKYVYDIHMYISEDFRWGSAYPARSTPNLRPICCRDSARFRADFPSLLTSRADFRSPVMKKKPSTSFPHHHQPVFQPLPPPMKSNPKKHQLPAGRRGRVSPSPTTKTSFSGWWQSSCLLLKEKKIQSD